MVAPVSGACFDSTRNVIAFPATTVAGLAVIFSSGSLTLILKVFVVFAPLGVVAVNVSTRSFVFPPKTLSAFQVSPLLLVN